MKRAGSSQSIKATDNGGDDTESREIYLQGTDKHGNDVTEKGIKTRSVRYATMISFIGRVRAQNVPLCYTPLYMTVANETKRLLLA